MKREKVINKLKAIGEVVSSGSAEALACGICAALLPPGVNVIAKGGVMLGGLLLGGFVGDKLNDYVSDQIDATVKNIDDTVSEIKRCIDVIQDKTEENETKNEGDAGA